MITIFKAKKDIPQNKEYVELNDLFFNQNTAAVLDERASGLLKKLMLPSFLANIEFSQDLMMLF